MWINSTDFKTLLSLEYGTTMIQVNNNHNPIGEYDDNMCDFLTGLPKYEYFVANLRRIIESHRGKGNFKLAIVYSDIRHFKYLNETFGYSHGNKLLCMFSEFARSKHPIFLGVSRVYSDNFVMAVDITNFPTNEAFYFQVERFTISQRLTVSPDKLSAAKHLLDGKRMTVL